LRTRWPRRTSAWLRTDAKNERTHHEDRRSGGSGLIGDKVVTALHDAGHKPVAASPAFEIDAFTGEGLDEAMTGADVVVDVSNAPAWGTRRSWSSSRP
jgi:hypothetical protein